MPLHIRHFHYYKIFIIRLPKVLYVRGYDYVMENGLIFFSLDGFNSLSMDFFFEFTLELFD